MATLQPLEATNAIRSAYTNYILTSNPVRQPDLYEKLREELSKDDYLVKGPFLEGAPPYRSGATILELVDEGLLSPQLLKLSDELPPSRPLYKHQEAAIRLAQQQRNMIVATGTGSGKTESFMLPILNALLREEEEGTIGQPGVRALLLYPMNALANDQVKRLRHLLKPFPNVTFGRYTGETRNTEVEAKERYVSQFGDQEILPNEMLSREHMRETPPHILLTNYAMLEYLLLRPSDCSFFDNATGKHWKFLVLDEAHTYNGASGIEVGMLIRRLKDRIGKAGQLQCIATSATIGSGRADFPEAARFATELFGEKFEWDETDPLKQDIVEASRVEAVDPSSSPWGKPSKSFYANVLQCIEEQGSLEREDSVEDDPWALPQPDPVFEIELIAQQASVPADVLERCVAEAQGGEHTSRKARVGALLYHLLKGDERVQALQLLLAEKRFCSLKEAAEAMFEDPEHRMESVVAVVALAARARTSPNAHPLLPARYHVFARALEGAFACLNREKHPDGKAWLSLSRHVSCPICDSPAHELAACSRCGASYFVGKEDKENKLVHESGTAPEARSLYLFDGVIQAVD